MHHHFNIDVAKEYGLEVAVMVNHLDFWLEKNAANNKNVIDGKVWTYNSVSAFGKLFPYWSDSQIRRILKKMEDKEIILTANHNKRSYDRSTWYTFTEKFVETNKSILRFRQIHLTNSSNGSDDFVKPIPDNKPYEKPDSITYVIVEDEKLPASEKRYQRLMKEYGEQTTHEYLRRVLAYCDSTGKKYKDYAAAAETFMRRDGVRKIMINNTESPISDMVVSKLYGGKDEQ